MKKKKDGETQFKEHTQGHTQGHFLWQLHQITKNTPILNNPYLLS